VNRTCTKCHETKPLEGRFYRHATNKSGYHAWCKSCCIEQTLAHKKHKQLERDNNLTNHVIASSRVCTKCLIEKPLSNFYRDRMSLTGYRSDCKTCNTKRTTAYQKQNPEKATEYQRDYYSELGRAIKFAQAAKRRAAKIKATPKWANNETIISIYFNCPNNYHVDHIVPLNSPIVCGLHWEQNLEYLSGPENLTKGNYHWPTMTAQEVREATKFYTLHEYPQ
jgi:hypothetical protein